MSSWEECMTDNPQKTPSAVRHAHGVVTTIPGGRLTELDADAPAARVNSGQGGSCALTGGGQTISYNEKQDRIAIQRGGAVVAILNPRTAIGAMVDVRSGTVEVASNSPAASPAARMLAVRLNESFAGERMPMAAGVSGDIAHIRQVMQEVGLRCTDEKGKPTGPSLTPRETAMLTDNAVKGR